MGLSTRKQTQTTNQTQSGTANTTPTNPQWVTDAVQGLAGRFGEFGQTDPGAYVAGTNPLLRQAFANAGSLSGWNGRPALDLLQQAAGAGPSLAGAPQTYQAPQLGPAQTYQAPRLGEALLAAVQGYDPVQAGRVQVGDVPQARAHDAAAQSLLTGLSDYMNPFTRDVVDTTLAGFDDQAGRIHAQQQAAAARNKAFGGSRYAIQQAQTTADLARERAASEAGLRAQAFNTGAALSGQDADRRQQAGLTNAAARTAVSQFNAGQGLQALLAQAGFDMQGNLFDAGALNDSRSQLAQSMTQASLQQAANQNQRDVTGAGLAAEAMRHAADTGNQFTVNQAALDEAARRHGADIGNQLALFDAQQREAALGRQLQAAGLMGQLGSQQAADARADAALQAQLGGQAQALDQARAQAPMTQLQLLSQLYGGLPLNLFTGQNVSTTGNLEGTTTTRSAASPFDVFMALASLVPKPGGGGG